MWFCETSMRPRPVRDRWGCPGDEGNWGQREVTLRRERVCRCKATPATWCDYCTTKPAGRSRYNQLGDSRGSLGKQTNKQTFKVTSRQNRAELWKNNVRDRVRAIPTTLEGFHVSKSIRRYIWPNKPPSLKKKKKEWFENILILFSFKYETQASIMFHVKH